MADVDADQLHGFLKCVAHLREGERLLVLIPGLLGRHQDLGAKSTDPLDGDSFAIWAVNFPDDRTIVGAQLFHRPMEVRYPGTVSPYNINQTGNATTAANYLDGAPVVATWP